MNLFFFLSFFFLASCSLHGNLHPDPRVNISIVHNYTEVETQLDHLEQMFRDYRGKLSRDDVAIMNRAMLDVKHILLPSIREILSQPQLRVTTPQITLLHEKGRDIYLAVADVINRNRALLTQEDEQALLVVGGHLREVDFNLNLSIENEKLRAQTIEKLLQVIIEGGKALAGVVL